MKQLRKFFLAFAIIGTLSIGLSSCNSNSKRDNELKDRVEATVPSGISVSVENGMVTLTGEFQNESAREQTVSSVRGLTGVTDVHDNTSLSVPNTSSNNNNSNTNTSNNEMELRNGVNDAVRNYSAVRATVQNGVVTLEGEISRDELSNLMQDINSLNPVRVDNKLTIR